MADFKQNPGELNIFAVVGNDLTIPLQFDINLTNYTFQAILLWQQNGVTKPVTITVTNTNLASGIISLSLTDSQMTAIGEVTNRPWYLDWTVGGLTRTVLAGNFTLNRR